MDVALVTNCQHSKQLVCHLQVLQTTLENNFRHFGAPTPKLTVSLSLSKGQLRCSRGTMVYIPYWMLLGWVVLDEMVFTIYHFYFTSELIMPILCNTVGQRDWLVILLHGWLCTGETQTTHCLPSLSRTVVKISFEKQLFSTSADNCDVFCLSMIEYC